MTKRPAPEQPQPSSTRAILSGKESLMRWQCSVFALIVLSSPALAQEGPAGVVFPAAPNLPSSETMGPWAQPGAPLAREGEGARFASNRNFPNFIGFMSNP